MLPTKKENSVTGDSSGLLKMERYTKEQRVEWIMEQQQVDADFSNKIIFNDEAHFHLDGFVNRQNCRI
ncbi:hypothetical protein ANTRET_LOCUS4812 [Anthophora retusa]